MNTVFLIRITMGEWEDTTSYERIHHDEQAAIALAKQLLAEEFLSDKYYAETACVNVVEMPLDGGTPLRNVFTSVDNEGVNEEVQQLMAELQQARDDAELERLRLKGEQFNPRLGDFFPSNMQPTTH